MMKSARVGYTKIVGWGIGEEAWSIDHLILPGDPTREEVWTDLEDVLTSEYKHASGAYLPLSMACIDSGYLTSHVYRFVKALNRDWVRAIKGMSGEGRPIVQPAASLLAEMRKRRKRAKAEIIGVDDGKSLLYKRLQITEPGPGYLHFPKERDREYLDQLTAEKLVIRYKKGRPHREWLQIRPRNEILDCWIYALAALRLLDPDIQKIKARIVQARETPRAAKDKRKSSVAALKPLTAGDPWLG